MGDSAKVGDWGKMPGNTLCWAQLMPQWSCCRIKQGLSVHASDASANKFEKEQNKVWQQDRGQTYEMQPWRHQGQGRRRRKRCSWGRAEIPLKDSMVEQIKRCKKTEAAERNSCVMTIIPLSWAWHHSSHHRSNSVPGVVPRKGSRDTENEGVKLGTGKAAEKVQASCFLFSATQSQSSNI